MKFNGQLILAVAFFNELCNYGYDGSNFQVLPTDVSEL